MGMLLAELTRLPLSIAAPCVSSTAVEVMPAPEDDGEVIVIQADGKGAPMG